MAEPPPFFRATKLPLEGGEKDRKLTDQVEGEESGKKEKKVDSLHPFASSFHLSSIRWSLFLLMDDRWKKLLSQTLSLSPRRRGGTKAPITISLIR